MATPKISTTSFQKRVRSNASQIPGAKVSVQNAQLIISTGVPSLDYFLGGGLAVGTILLFEEDVYGTYAKLLLKYFVAEGVVHGHFNMVSSGSIPPEKLIRELPSPTTVPNKSTVNESGETLKIAWRYQNKPGTDTGDSNINPGHIFDISSTMKEKMIKDIYIWDIDSKLSENIKDINLLPKSYLELLQAIRHKIKDAQLGTHSQSDKRNILRIAILSLGSPLWTKTKRHINDVTDICRFLYFLRAMLRSSFAAAVVTLPSTLMHNATLIERSRQMCDTVIRLESFMGSDKETNPLYKDYHGLLQIIKLPRLNSLTCHTIEQDLAFKLKRKTFCVEKLHLPPDLSDTASRSQEKSIPKPGCFNKDSRLEF